MSDPIAQAAANLQDAAPSSTEPSLLERAAETIHDLEAKIEHLMHPDQAAEIVKQEAGSAEPGETAVALGAANAEHAPSSSNGQSAESSQTSVASVPPETSGVDIRSHIQAIKGHLAGFEAGTVAKIHAELEAIERLI